MCLVPGYCLPKGCDLRPHRLLQTVTFPHLTLSTISRTIAYLDREPDSQIERDCAWLSALIIVLEIIKSPPEQSLPSTCVTEQKYI